MLFAPPLLPLSLLSLAATIALVGGGVWLVYAWVGGIVVGTGYLIAGLALLAWSLAGRWLVLLVAGRRGHDDPRPVLSPDVDCIRRPDGTELHVERFGPVDGPPVVFTHGWGTSSEEWYYVKRALADRYRVITWDLRGLGRSSRPPSHDYALETLAQDLDAVLEHTTTRPAVLVGHSIGGMITLTYCRLFADRLRRRVAGIALVNTTYTNPVHTTTFSGLFSALQKPVIEPLMHLVTWTSPLVWVLDWLSYQNGTAHLVSRLTGFAGAQSRGQLDFATRLSVRPAPATLARGVLAMFRYDATGVLPALDVPALVITANRDRILVPQASAVMRDRLPHAELVSLEPAGHMGLLEQHAAFIAALGRFLGRAAAAQATHRAA